MGPFVIFFDTGSTRLTPQATTVLDNFAETWRQLHIGRTVLEGHADRAGPADFNRKLSCARARAVRAYLVAHGLPKSALFLVGRGEDDPLVETRDGASEPQNRRTELNFEPFEHIPVSGPTDHGC